jgi:uroporphyrinogen-III synthase
VSKDTLDGFVVAVTAGRRAGEQAELLRRRGAHVVLAPTITTSYLGDDDRLRAATQEVIAQRPAVVVAMTGIGLRAWIESAQAWCLDDALLDALAHSRLVARGPKAAGAVQAMGLPLWATSGDETMAGVERILSTALSSGHVVAVQCDGEERHGLERMSGTAGALLLEIPVYRWEIPRDPAAAARAIEAALDGQIDAFTFTSAPAVRHLFRIAEDQLGAGAALSRAFDERIVAACVGPVCLRAALDAGIRAPVAPDKGRLGLLVRALTDRLRETVLAAEVGATHVRLQGSVARIEQGGDRREVRLSRREAALLRALLERPGAVLSRTQLGRASWTSVPPSFHALEVSVGRLRRRLDGSGLSVVAVARRGYRLVACGTAPDLG